MDGLSGRGSSSVRYHEELEYHPMRGRGLSGVWHHGELEYHRTRPWGVIQHSMRSGWRIYGRKGEGRGKCVRKTTEERKREANKADKVEAAPGRTVRSLRRFRAVLIGQSQELPKQHRLHR